MNKFQKNCISIILVFDLFFLNLIPLLAEAKVTKIGPKEFNYFLNDCNMEDRLQLGLTLDLITQEEYANKKNWKDIESRCSLNKIRYEINYRSYHFFSSTSNSEVNYHEIVEWVADSMGVGTLNKSTQDLEEEIVKKVMEKIWDNLTITQRKDLLLAMQKNTGKKIDNIDDLILKSGQVVISSLIALKAVFGFKFFSLAMVFLKGVATILGITLPFGVYTGLASLLGFLTGPYGWIILIISLAVTAGQPDPNDAIKFVITSYFIRMHHIEEKAKIAKQISQKSKEEDEKQQLMFMVLVFFGILEILIFLFFRIRKKHSVNLDSNLK